MIELTTTIGNYTIKVEGESQVEAFDRMAEMAELISCGSQCGKSGATDTIPVVRKKDDYTFREWKCVSSGAALSLGQKKDGTGLFPKRKKDGEFLDNYGWQTWSERKEDMQPAGAKGDGDWSSPF